MAGRGSMWLAIAVIAGGLLAISAPSGIPVLAVSTIDGVGLFDPDQGRWHLRDPGTGAIDSFYFGNPNDIPIMGDWDCDGVATPGLFRPSDAFFYLRNSNTRGIADLRFFAGDPNDVPLAGDWDGDGCDTVGLFRTAQNRIFLFDQLADNNAGLGAADVTYVFGDLGDKPFAGDFDGNGADEIGLHRESTGLVYYRLTHTTGVADAQFIFGDPEDRLVAGDWTGDGMDTVGVFRPSITTFFFRYTNTQGNADEQFAFGESDWLPVAGPLVPPPPPPNRPPVAADDAFTVVDGDLLVDGVLDNDSDPDGDSLGAKLVQPPAAGDLKLAADGSFTYQHDGSGPGTDTFRYRASDGQAESDPARVVITIVEKNEPPVIDDQSFVVPEQSPTGTVAGFVKASDPNQGDQLRFDLTGGSGAGLFSLSPTGTLRTAAGDLDFDIDPASPEPRGPGPFDLQVRVSDAAGLSDAATLTVALDPVNDNSPMLDPSQTFLIAENSPSGTTVASPTSADDSVNADDADLPGDQLTFGIVGGTGASAFAIDAATGIITVVDGTQLDFEVSPSLLLDVEVTDNGIVPGPLTSTTTLTVDIEDANEAPTAANVGAGATEDGPVVSGAFAGDDEDADDDPTTLTYAIVSPPAEGAATVSSGDATKFDFDPGADFQDLAAGAIRDVTFDYTATDSHGASSSPATVTVTVTGVNDQPVVTATPGDTFFVGAPVVVDGGLTVADVDDATLVSATVTIAGPLDPGFETLEALPSGAIAAAHISYTEPTLTIAPPAGAPVADFEAVLRSVAYGNTGPMTPGPRPIEFTAADSAGAGPAAVKTVLV